MRWLIGLAVSAGAVTWAALGADRPAGGGPGAPATAPAVVTTRPAEGARAMPGPRGRQLLEGRPRREPGVLGPLGRRGSAETRPGFALDEPLTPEKVDQVLHFARDNFPQVYERLLRLRQVDPASFRDIVRKMRGRMEAILEADQRDPQLAKRLIQEHRLQISIMELSQKYRRAASDLDRARIQVELLELLCRQFDLSQERTRQEIENLRHRLDDQERRLADREKRKEQILRRQLDAAINRPRPGRDAEAAK